MTIEQKRFYFILLAVAVLVAGALINYFAGAPKAPDAVPAPFPMPGISTPSVPPAPQGYQAGVPRDATPTKPAESVPILNDQGKAVAQFGSFVVQATRTSFAPAIITVKKGNMVEIELVASDAAYDLFSKSGGFYVAARPGESGKISFTPTLSGTFQFECKDYCPAEKKIQGELIVLP